MCGSNDRDVVATTNESMIALSSSSSSSSLSLQHNSNQTKQQPCCSHPKKRRPTVPLILKYLSYLLWMGIIGYYVVYQQENLNYFLFVTRTMWTIVLLVSLRRDGHSGGVEYNIQSKCIVAMMCYSGTFWLLHSNNWFGTGQYCIEYYAMGICAACQSFENAYQIMYCRPSPFRRTQYIAMEGYLLLPVLLLLMLRMKQQPQHDNIGGISTVFVSNYSRVMAVGITLYKFIRTSWEYHQIGTIQTETVPLQHKFTTTLDTTVKVVSSDDSSTNLWRIYGNTYDMTHFVECHPGGVEAIMLGANRDDCTALFQSYHPFNITKAKQLLDRYRVANAKTVTAGSSTPSSTAPQKTNHSNASVENIDAAASATPAGASATPPPIDTTIVAHENDLFYDVLCRRVRKTLLQSNIDPIRDRIPNTVRCIYYVFLIMATLFSCIRHCQGSLLGSFLFGVFGWLLLAIGHDGGHYAVSHNPMINDIALWGMSLLSNPIMWQHQHTYAHHTYTNEYERDPDLHHFDMFLRYHKRYIPHSFFYKNQTNKWLVILIFGLTCFGECYWIPFRFIQERSLYGAVQWSDRKRCLRSLLFFVHFIVYSIVVMTIPFFVYQSSCIAFIAAMLPMVVSSWLFAFVSQVGHITENCINAKSNVIEKSKRHPIAIHSWAADQVVTTNDFCPQHAMWHFLTNGLTLQVEHHLFPGLNHCHLMLIQPTVEQVCIEYGVKYNKYETWGEVMQSTFDYLNKLAQE